MQAFVSVGFIPLLQAAAHEVIPGLSEGHLTCDHDYQATPFENFLGAFLFVLEL